MSFTKTKTPDGVITLHCTVSKNDAAVAGYHELKGQYRVPGFRPGKVPMAYLERMVGRPMLVSYGIYTMADRELKEYNKGDAENYFGQPGLVEDSVDLSDEENVTFDVTLPGMPEVTVPELSEIKVPYEDMEYTDDILEDRIQRDLKAHERKVMIEDKGVAEGDHVVVDITAVCDGQDVPGLKEDNRELVLGNHYLVPGFEEIVVGMKAGEEKEGEITFPETFDRAPEVQGKAVTMHVTVKNAFDLEVPELNDEYVADTTEFENVAAYREDMAKRVQKDIEDQNRLMRMDMIISMIVSKCNVTFLDPVKEFLVNYELTNQSGRDGAKLRKEIASMQGGDIYLQSMENDILNNYAANLVIDKLLEMLEVDATDEEVDQELEKSASGKSAEELRKLLSESQLENVKHQVKVNKLYELLPEKVQLVSPDDMDLDDATEVPVSTEEETKPQE
ncbi:MAG: trigger factor [Clostridia bacterium]|nr:trigger factor [Clostridia bacterium]